MGDAKAVSNAGLSDEVTVEVNGVKVPDATLPHVGDRPSEKSTKAKWVDYAERLGLDRTVGEGWTRTQLIGWVDGTPPVEEG